jgi:hypothetical protein
MSRRSVERERRAFIAGPYGSEQESHVVSCLRNRLPDANVNAITEHIVVTASLSPR